MHISLRRLEIDMARQFLNRASWRTLHRQMRAERVTKDVEPARRTEPSPLLRRLEEVAQKEARRGARVVEAS